MVGRRRHLLKYLRENDVQRYRELIQDLDYVDNLLKKREFSRFLFIQISKIFSRIKG